MHLLRGRNPPPCHSPACPGLRPALGKVPFSLVSDSPSGNWLSEGRRRQLGWSRGSAEAWLSVRLEYLTCGVPSSLCFQPLESKDRLERQLKGAQDASSYHHQALLPPPSSISQDRLVFSAGKGETLEGCLSPGAESTMGKSSASFLEAH